MYTIQGTGFGGPFDLYRDADFIKQFDNLVDATNEKARLQNLPHYDRKSNIAGYKSGHSCGYSEALVDVRANIVNLCDAETFEVIRCVLKDLDQTYVYENE